MRSVSFYHKDTGLLNGSHLMVSNDHMVALNTPPDHLPIDGHHDCLSKCVDLATGKIIEHQPPAPSLEHEWNAEKRRWVVKEEVQGRIDRRVVAVMKIDQLEKKELRVLREIVIRLMDLNDVESSRLLDIEKQIEELRKDL